MSQVVKDEDMPILETGEHVEIIFNPMGIINRLNPEQLFELSITFIMSRLYEKLDEMIVNKTSRKELDDTLTNILDFFNTDQANKLRSYLSSLKDIAHEMFYHDMINETGLPVIKPPMWEDEPLIDKLTRLYKENPWIEPYDVYFNRFGRIIKGMRPLYAGDMYLLKLKQTSEKGFSARATGPVTVKGLPEKTQRRQKHQEPYSKTPIRFGGDENNNMHIGVDEDTIAQVHMFFRSSVVGRQLLSKNLGSKIGDVDLELMLSDDRVTNRNIEILQSYNKVLGLRMEYHDQEKIVVHENTDRKERINPLNGDTVHVTDKEFALLQIEKEMKDAVNFSGPIHINVMSPEEHNEWYTEQLKKRFIEKFNYW